MNEFDQRQKVVDYVLRRRCPSGGFCFYQLDEPNGSDCYYALNILHLLDASFHDQKTIVFLRNMQHGDGAYDSIFSAFYSIKSLQLLNEKPASDPVHYLLKHLHHCALDVRKLPAEILSIFKRLLYLVDLYRSLEMERDKVVEDNIIRLILSFENEDRGFGHDRSSLSETSKAIFMLDRLGYPLRELETEHFIRQCETPPFGFTDMPRRSLSYMEYIHAGVLASSLLSYKPHYDDRCIDFILSCRNTNGGFSRAPHAGIATLENTFLAVHALNLLLAPEKRL